jgi:hypothetical protein
MYQNIVEFLILVGLLVGSVAIAFGLKWLCKKYRFPIHAVLGGLGFFMLGMEIYKAYNFLSGDVPNWRGLPFYICSFFIWFSVVGFFGKGKLRTLCYSLSLMLGLGVSLVMLVYPSVIFGTYLLTPFEDWFTLHSVTFHFAIFLHSMILLVVFPFKPERSLSWLILTVYAGLFLISFVATMVFKYDYCRYLSVPLSAMLGVDEALNPYLMLGLYLVFIAGGGAAVNYFVLSGKSKQKQVTITT